MKEHFQDANLGPTIAVVFSPSAHLGFAVKPGLKEIKKISIEIKRM